MMMVLEFGRYSIDINVEKTEAFYETAEPVSQGCQCDGCKNFECAVDTLPTSVKSFFRTVGVDPRKACECYINCSNPDGTLLYGGFYHICGTMLNGVSAWQKSSEDTSFWNNDAAFPVSAAFRVSFQDEINLLEAEFPLPVIQLEFSANIPWVLNRENPYG